jgi:hypothetical protein
VKKLCQKVHRSKFSQGRGGGKQKQEIPHTFLPQENFIINHVVGEATLLKEPSLSRPKQNIEKIFNTYNNGGSFKSKQQLCSG